MAKFHGPIGYVRFHDGDTAELYGVIHPVSSHGSYIKQRPLLHIRWPGGGEQHISLSQVKEIVGLDGTVTTVEPFAVITTFVQNP